MLKAADHPMLMGKGGRMPNNEVRKMQGMNLASLRHHVALQPLAVIMVGGMIFVGAYIARLAVKTTDVNCYKARQFQMFNPSGKDYEKIAADRVARGEINYRE